MGLKNYKIIFMFSLVSLTQLSGCSKSTEPELNVNSPSKGNAPQLEAIVASDPILQHRMEKIPSPLPEKLNVSGKKLENKKIAISRDELQASPVAATRAETSTESLPPSGNLPDFKGEETLPEKRQMLDRLTFSPGIGYYLVRTNLRNRELAVQLSTKVSPGFELQLEQNWSDKFRSYAEIKYYKYEFSTVSALTAKDFNGASWGGSAGAKYQKSIKLAWGGEVNLSEDFAIATDLATSSLQLVRYTRPSIGAFLDWSAWMSEAGSVQVIPFLHYALPVKNEASASDGHLAYGISLEANRNAKQLFSSTGLGIQYQASNFESSQGKNKNSSLLLKLKFSFSH